MTDRQDPPVEELLDQAIASLQQGASPEPSEMASSDELPSLVALAARLHQLAATPPLPASLAGAGRAAFLRQAAEMKKAGSRTRRWRVPVFLLPLARRWATAAALCVILLAAVFGGSHMMTSASSIPGDPFYPVKRAAESVQLALTFAPESRAALEHKIEERRLSEVRAILERRRRATATFRGIVTAYADAQLDVAGISVHLTSTTRFIGQPPRVGDLIAIVALNQPDLGLVAQRIQVLPVTPSPTPSVTATASATEGASATTAITLTVTITPSATLTGTEVPTDTITPTATLTATAAISHEGELEVMEPGRWWVGGRAVLLDEQTQVDETAALAEVGAQVHVVGWPIAENALQAQQVTVVQAAAQPAQWLSFVGQIEAVEEAAWVISGQRVTHQAYTRVPGELRSGTRVAVRARQMADGSLRALWLVACEPSAALLSGPIETITDTCWVVGGSTVDLATDALLLGEPAVGLQATLWGERYEDGRLLVLVAEIIQPTPTATAPPAATATATTTAAPTTTPTTTPTPRPKASLTPPPPA